MTLCRYTDLFIIIIVVFKIFVTPDSKDPRWLLLILLLLFFYTTSCLVTSLTS